MPKKVGMLVPGLTPSSRRIGETRMPAKKSLEAYRAGVEDRLDRLAIILRGDPDITNEADPDHYRNSVLGRIDRSNTRVDSIEEKNAASLALVREAIDDLREEVRTNTFGWPTVRKLLSENWKWLIAFVAFGFLYAHDHHVLGL